MNEDKRKAKAALKYALLEARRAGDLPEKVTVHGLPLTGLSREDLVAHVMELRQMLNASEAVIGRAIAVVKKDCQQKEEKKVAANVW
jgi:hypothetical protein